MSWLLTSKTDKTSSFVQYCPGITLFNGDVIFNFNIWQWFKILKKHCFLWFGYKSAWLRVALISQDLCQDLKNCPTLAIVKYLNFHWLRTSREATNLRGNISLWLLPFQITVPCLGGTTTVDLVPNGGSLAVNKNNRDHFVTRYVDYILNRSIESQFEVSFHITSLWNIYTSICRISKYRLIRRVYPK